MLLTLTLTYVHATPVIPFTYYCLHPTECCLFLPNNTCFMNPQWSGWVLWQAGSIAFVLAELTLVNQIQLWDLRAPAG